MENQEIQSKVQKLKTVDDLASLLTAIKKDEFVNAKTPVTRKQLLHFANSKIVPNRYHTFHIRKKSGGLREINAPTHQLNVLLRLLNIMLKAVYTPGPSAMGFTTGRSIVDNAAPHIGQHYVLNLDLSNFFPSIPQARVWARIQCPPFNFTKEVASVIAGLCCTENEDKTGNVLPQGAPTSPLLTNAICDRLDRQMRALARRLGLHYSRYADDMTFSSMYNVFQPDGDFMKEVRDVVTGQGFTLNEKKTRLLRTGQRQEVTGLTVNERVNVSRKYVRDLRCILHVWEKEGYGKAYSYFYPHYKSEKGYIKKGEPVMENVIDGKLNFLRMVKGATNACYQKLLKRYQSLLLDVFTDDSLQKESYTYVQPYAMADFETDFQTKVTLVVTPKGKLVGKCKIAESDKTIAISKATQEFLCPSLASSAPGDTITSKFLDNCFVTLCRQKGKNFWMITKFKPKRSRCLPIPDAKLDHSMVDEVMNLWKEEGLAAAVDMFADWLNGGIITKSKQVKPKNKSKNVKKAAGLTPSLDDIIERLRKSGFDLSLLAPNESEDIMNL